jgi:hypothetical protein
MVAASDEGWDELIAGGAEPAKPAAIAYAQPAGAGDKSNDMKLVERLLAKHDLSDTLRGDLEDFRRQLVSGKLDQMDAEYLRALAKRLGA